MAALMKYLENELGIMAAGMKHRENEFKGTLWALTNHLKISREYLRLL